MLKVIYYSLVLLIMAASVFVMNGYHYLARPHGPVDNVPLHMTALKASLDQHSWYQADQQYQGLNTAWQKIKPRIQFSVEKDEMDAIDLGLARLGVFIRAQDQIRAAVELSEIEAHWSDLSH